MTDISCKDKEIFGLLSFLFKHSTIIHPSLIIIYPDT